jgi:hypothetical protein
MNYNLKRKISIGPMFSNLFHLYQYLYNKRARPTKNEPQQQEISYLKRERERVVQAGQQAGIFKVRLVLGVQRDS